MKRFIFTFVLLTPLVFLLNGCVLKTNEENSEQQSRGPLEQSLTPENSQTKQNVQQTAPINSPTDLENIEIKNGEALTLEDELEIAEKTDDSESQVSPDQIFEISARQFSFTPQVITVKKGSWVRMIVTSQDVDHGIVIPELGIDELLPAKEPVEIEFIADIVGEFPFQCSLACGSGHGDMKGKIIVTE